MVEQVVDGLAFRLRPVTIADALFVDTLRQDARLTQFLNPANPGVQAQEHWIREQILRRDDYYFVVESKKSSESVGLVSLYGVNRLLGDGEWGRWIVKPNSFSAIESVLLVLRFGFDQLGLNSVFCRTVADNKKVLSFLDSCGLNRVGKIENYVVLEGRPFDVIEHRILAESWGKVEENLERRSSRLARKFSLG